MLSTLLTIALLHWVALVTPGVNFLLLTQLAASGQRGSACYAALGISVVAGLWALSAVLGVNAVFAAQPQIRLGIQVAGGIYLCYLAFQFWRSDASAASLVSVQLTPMAAFRLGVLTNITNPKSVLFFGSVYATALPASPGTSVLVAAVVLAFLNALSWHLVLAVAFSQSRVQAAYAAQHKLISRIAGAVLGAFGLRLLVDTVAELRMKSV